MKYFLFTLLGCIFFSLAVEASPISGLLIDGDSVSISATTEMVTSVAAEVSPIESPTFQKSTGLNLMSVLRGALGIAFLIVVSFLFSSNRSAIDWKMVFIGLLVQLVMAVSILHITFVQHIFEFFGKAFVKVIDFTREGSVFLFGDLMNIDSFGFIFAFQVLPTIIFFSALTSLLFYWGIIQKVVSALAIMMTKAFGISGAESLSVAGNIFLGQTESPLMIKGYLERMNRSEIFLVMVGGMATLAGGVLASYINFLGGDDPVQKLMFAKHLLSASVMAAPGAVVISKIIYPQTEEVDNSVEIPKEKVGSNALDAISNGTVDGLKLAVNVAAMLLVFLSLMALFNYILMKMGGLVGLNDWIVSITDGQYLGFDLKFVLGYLFSPLMWLLGVCADDISLVGRLLGEKVIINEYIGYSSLADLKEAGAFVQEKSIIMATYILCGFANFGSIGIQIGGIGSLAPSRKAWLSEMGMKALLAGTLASCLSATIVGMLLG